MADLLLSSNHLRHFLSFNSSRHFPLPLSPPHSNLSFIRFTSFRRTTRLSPSSLLTKLSSDSSPFDIISTAEHPDGSIVFKFGDASEIPQIEEPSNSSDGEVDVNDSKIIVVGISNGEHDDVSTAEDDAEKEVLEASDTVHEAKSELLVEKLERESVTDEELPKFDENSVDKETELQETATKTELLGLSGETDESSGDSVHNLQSVDQLNGASNSIEDGEDQDSVSVKHVVTEDDDSSEPLGIDKNSLVEASGVAVSLEHSELESDVKDVVSEVNEQPAQVEAEPMLVEEGSNHSVDDVVKVELASVNSLVNDDAPSTLAQHDDDPSAGDILEVASSEASGMSSAEINLDSVNDVEISTPTLSLSSAAASLPHESEALAGGVDAYFVCQNWFGVADGVGQWSLGGTNEGKYAQELMQNCERLATNNQNAELKELKEVLQQSAAMTQSAGSARVLIAHFANQVLHVVNIGDSGFIIIRNGAVFKKSSPMVHEFSFPYAISSGDDPLEAAEEYHIDLEDGDLIISATDGLFDNLYEQEIASIVYKSVGAGMELKALAELLVAKAQEVGRTPSARTPFADAAQAAGHTGYNGGKLDHVTVIVSLVQKA